MRRLTTRPLSLESRPGAWEFLFAVLSLLLFSGAVLPLIRISSGVDINETGSDQVLQGAFVCIYCGMMAAVMLKVRRWAELVIKFWPAWLLVALSCASALWSDSPEITVRRAAALFASTLFGHYLAVRFKDQHVHVLAICLIIGLSASAIFGAFSADAFHTDLRGETFRGVFVEKNGLGRAAALALVLFAALGLSGLGRKQALCGGGLALVLLILSGSITGMVTAVATVLGVVSIAAYSRSARTWGTAVVLLVAMIVSGLIVTWVSSPETLLEATGRDTTLTGRTTLWEASVASLAGKIWLGHGFGAFWRGLDGPSSDIWSELVWRPPHSHNGFLDLLLDLGIVGLVLYLIVFVTAARRALRATTAKLNVMSLWAPGFLVFLIVSNLTESSLLRQNNLLLVLFVATSATLADANREVKSEWRRGVYRRA